MAEINAGKEEKWLDDRLVRAIGIPFFGLVIPFATGLLDTAAFSTLKQVLSFGVFILLAAVVWEGNRFLLFRNYASLFRSASSLQKYWLMIGLNILYTAPVSLALLWGWKFAFSASHVNTETVLITTAVIVVCVIFVTNVYEKVLFAHFTDQEQRRIQQLQAARLEAELAALKSQIDPHFMFNALNSISYLIDSDTARAQEFIAHLSEVYRYLLRTKEKDLVMLREELAFMHAYVGLMELRHEGALEVNCRLNGREDFLLPPVSLMVAVENAIKHNEVSVAHRLIIEVEQQADKMTISNPILPRKNARESTKNGLVNLNERFEKIVGKAIEITDANGVFQVQLPMLKIDR